MTKLENVQIRDLIQTHKEPPESKFSGLSTYSSLFLLPMTGISLSDRTIFKYFVNAYIDDFGLKHDYKKPIFVLFQSDTFNIEYKRLEAIFLQKENFLLDYSCGMNGDKNLVMFVFECPALFADDYVRFLNGQYSKFSDFYKRFFSKTIYSNNQVVEHPIWGVMNKSASTKKKIEDIIGQKLNPNQEYWSIIQNEREIYNYDN